MSHEGTVYSERILTRCIQRCAPLILHFDAKNMCVNQQITYDLNAATESVRTNTAATEVNVCVSLNKRSLFRVPTVIRKNSPSLFQFSSSLVSLGHVRFLYINNQSDPQGSDDA